MARLSTSFGRKRSGSANGEPRPPRERAERVPPPPLDAPHLRDLGLRYVGKYATSAAKLKRYLERKLWERGWSGEGAAPVADIVEKFVGLGYIDDRAFGESRARGLVAKGFGSRRIGQDLNAAGIEKGLAGEISEKADGRTVAEAFARRRRFGPYDPGGFDPDRHRKQVAAMMRAGHDYATVRAVLKGDPSEEEFPED